MHIISHTTFILFQFTHHLFLKKKRFQISYFFCKFNESSLNMFNASSVFSGGFVNFCCVRVMVFNATFNNISVITWRLVLLVEVTGVPGKNHQPVASHWQTLSHNFVSSTPRHQQDSNSQLECFWKSNTYFFIIDTHFNLSW